MYEPTTWELVNYDLGPGAHARTFTDWLRVELDELERSLEHAQVLAGHK